MVKVRSWRDAYLFLQKYGNFTCLNCKYSSHNLDTTMDHSDVEYALHFCSKTISMVSFEYMFVCKEWEHKDTGEHLEDLGEHCYSWNLSDSVIDTIEDEKNGKWSIEEIEALINEEESIKQEG